MNSGLIAALGTQPLKTQRIFNSPYGPSISIPNNIANTTVNSSQNRVNNDTPGFQVKDSNNRKAFVISPDSGGQRTITFQSSQAPVGVITWNGFDRSVTLGFNNFIYTNSYFSSVFFSSTTIGGGRFAASNGNGTLSHFALWDDGQTTADVLALRNSTNAQAFRVYNTFTSLTNYERFTIDWQTKPNTCVIATSASSLSGVRGMEFRVGATTAMSIASSGNITFGVSGALSTPAITIAGNILSGGSSTTTSPLIDYRPSGSTPNFSTNGTLFGGNLPSGYLGDLFNYRYYNGAALFRVDYNGSLYSNYNASFGGGVDCNSFLAGQAVFCGNTLPGLAGAGGTSLRSSDVVGWSSTTTWFNAIDLVVRRDGSNSLAQRNGTNAQSYRLYNTFTSPTDYERFTIDWQTKPNTCVIATSASSLSGVRGLDFRVGTDTVVSMASASNNLSFFTDQNNYAGGSRIMFISNATTAPSANPVNGGYMFVSAGELKYRGSAGTITTLAPA